MLRRIAMSDTVVAPTVDTSSSPATTPDSSGRPASSYGAALQNQPQAQPHDPSKPSVKRQIVCFSFYKVMPEWRRLPAEERTAHKAEFAAVLAKWNKPGEFLAMTKRSQYQIDRPDESEGEGRGAIRPGGQKYIFIYPFWKTRPWYLLPATERKRLMDEHIRIGLMYPRVKLNTTYSFGVADQEFVVAFETNFPEDFLGLVT